MSVEWLEADLDRIEQRLTAEAQAKASSGSAG
jgi:hypothetical protein